jgi:hypothetical protein
MGRWNSTIAMNPELSSKFTLSDHKTVTVLVKRIKVGSKMAIAASAPVLPNQKKTVLQNRPIH